MVLDLLFSFLQATDPLKTPEQQQKEKQEKLKRLKTEAMNRMRGLPSSSDCQKIDSGDYIPDESVVLLS